MESYNQKSVSHRLPSWQLCTLSAFSQPASPRILFQQSWRSSHICWAPVGCFSFTLQSNSSQTISIGLRSSDCGGQVIWYSTITLLLGQIAFTQLGGVFVHCPVEKQMIVPLNAKQMDRRLKGMQPTGAQHMWELLQDCWKSILGEAGLENDKSVQSCQGKGWLIWRIYFDLFNTFLLTTWFQVCYFIVFMSTM